MTLEELNSLEEPQAEVEFGKCCGVKTWVQAMVQGRPYSNLGQLLEAAEKTWLALNEKDWLQTFDFHAKIGDLDSLKKKYANTSNWSKGEQGGMAGAEEATIHGLAQGNIDYENKFGFIFLIFASGKSAEQMLAILQERLKNSRSEEIKNVVIEQNKITQLRLKKLLQQE